MDTERLHDVLEEERQQVTIQNANKLADLIKNKDNDDQGQNKLKDYFSTFVKPETFKQIGQEKRESEITSNERPTLKRKLTKKDILEEYGPILNRR